eukprot:451559_1
MSWTNVSYPFSERSNALLINTNEFVILSVSNSIDHDLVGIHKFNTKTEEWTEIYQFDKSYGVNHKYGKYLDVWRTPWSIDTNTQLIYVCDGSFPFIFDIQNKSLREIETDLSLRTDSVLCIDNELHMIHDSGTKHVICDVNTTQSRTIHEFGELGDGYEGYGFIHLKSKEVILMFGGWNSSSESFNTIYEFSLATSQWKKFDVELPHNLSHFGIASTENDEFVVLIAGWIDGCDESRHVMIFDVNECKIFMSDAECPAGGYCSAVVTGNRTRDKLLTFGFIGECFKLEQFVNVADLPADLMLVICGYVCTQEIHAIIGVAHYKIDLASIIRRLRNYSECT